MGKINVLQASQLAQYPALKETLEIPIIWLVFISFALFLKFYMYDSQFNNSLDYCKYYHQYE